MIVIDLSGFKIFLLWGLGLSSIFLRNYNKAIESKIHSRKLKNRNIEPCDLCCKLSQLTKKSNSPRSSFDSGLCHMLSSYLNKEFSSLAHIRMYWTEWTECWYRGVLIVEQLLLVNNYYYLYSHLFFLILISSQHNL